MSEILLNDKFYTSLAQKLKDLALIQVINTDATFIYVDQVKESKKNKTIILIQN